MGLCQSSEQQTPSPSIEPITPPRTPLSGISLNQHQHQKNNTTKSTHLYASVNNNDMSELQMTPPATPPTEFTKTIHLQKPSNLNLNNNHHHHHPLRSPDSFQNSADDDLEITTNNPQTDIDIDYPVTDTEQDKTPIITAQQQSIQHKINWTMRLSSHPEIPNDHQPYHQSTGTFIKHESETVHSIQESTTYYLQPGVYIVGRNMRIHQNNDNEQDDENELESIDDIEPIQHTQNVSIIICGNGYDIYGIYNDNNNDIIDCLYGIGRNNYGQCGVGNYKGIINKTRIKFTNYKDNIKIKKVCASITGESTFFLSDNNKVFGCGRNNKSQLGFSDSFDDNYTLNRNEPYLVKYLNNIIDIKCAFNYSLALGTINIDIIIEYWSSPQILPSDIINVISMFHGWSVYSTQYSLYGGNGHGVDSTNSDRDHIKRWRKIEALDDIYIVKICTGYYHSLFLDSNGFLWSCGDNDHGQCGRINEDGQKLSTSLPKPIEFFVKNNIKIKDMKCGHYHNLAIDENNKLWTWGQNRFGQCGNNTLNNIYKPQLIDNINNIKKIECGSNHSYLLTMDNKHYLWGSNKYNECLVFDENEDKIKIPTEIELFKDIEINIFLGDRDTKWIIYGDNGHYNMNNNINIFDKNKSMISDGGYQGSMASIIVHQ